MIKKGHTWKCQNCNDIGGREKYKPVISSDGVFLGYTCRKCGEFDPAIVVEKTYPFTQIDYLKREVPSNTFFCDFCGAVFYEKLHEICPVCRGGKR
ncbi:MAG: hypothetical protein PHF37_09880 [Phycisphaerae bacterium]|nr:hypothetical protein [Phycisphaerae bacterium]